MLRDAILVLVVFLSLSCAAHAQTENVMVDEDSIGITEFKLTIGNDYYSLNQVNGIKEPIYVGKEVEITETIHIKAITDEIILKTNLQDPEWYVNLNAYTGDTVKINTTGKGSIDIKLEGVLVPDIVNEKITLNQGDARITLNRDKMLINEKTLLFSCIDSKGDTIVWLGIPVTHPDVVKVQEKMSECANQRSVLTGSAKNSFEDVCSGYESSINALVDYGLFDKAYMAANGYKKFLEAEDALYRQVDALNKQRYLFAVGALIIGLAIGFAISRRNKTGEEKW